jgi:thiol-disulfide isomerase/thioredoxin
LSGFILGLRFGVISKVLTSLVYLIALFSSAYAASPAEEKTVAEIKTPTTTVVHLWAPWCPNCLNELKSGGWTKVIKDHPQVNFLFVSVWNGGEDGAAMLKKYNVEGLPNVTILADPGPRTGNKIKEFAGMPLSWIPTTCIFKGGQLRYAMNYGELHFPVLEQFLQDVDAKW